MAKDISMKDNRFLQGVIGLLALALIVFVALLARNAAEQYNYIGKVPHDRDTITIGGEGKVSVKPDLALIDLGVQTDGKNVSDSQTQNTQKMNDIIGALKTLGVDPKDIQTSNYSIYPRYDYSNGKQTIIGYTVSQSVAVKVRNLDKVGDVLAKAGELGANQVGGISFTIDDPTSLKEQARTKAIDDARKKAEALSQQLGLGIVKVVSFSESSVTPPMPMYAMDKAVMGMGGANQAAAPSIQSGSLDVTSDVSVTFEVR